MTTMRVTETKKLFTPEQCDQIIKIGDALPLAPNRVTVKDNPYFRNCLVAWFPLDDETQWIFNKFLGVFTGCKLSRLEVLQYVVYREGMWCGWHMDRTKKNDHSAARTATAILQLSEPEDYQGGNMEILMTDESEVGKEDWETYSTPKSKSSVIFFEGDVCHRITKVTHGVRKALVCWGLE